MKRCLLALAFVLMNSLAHGAVPLENGAIIRFATVEEGRRLLMTRDAFIERLSPFDRAARLKTSREVPEPEFLRFVGSNVVEWTEADQTKLEQALRSMTNKLAALPLRFPKTILLVKTTGREEGGALYTRGHAIVIPAPKLGHDARELPAMLCHELFHVWSRHDPQTRERLYRAIGFEKCVEAAFPAALASRKLTNPDAPANDHRIRLQAGGRPVWAVPILSADAATYDPRRGGEFFDYLEFRFLVVEAGSAKIQSATAEPRLLEMREVSNFFEQVGRNTSYTIHPEEILASNFEILVLGKPPPRSPEVLAKMRQALGDGR